MRSTSNNAPLWDAGQGLALPTLAGEIETDVCVVGLGGSGLVCANELARLGARVVGLDAGQVGSGAAGRNGGFLLSGVARFYHDAVASYGRERARRMYQLSLAELDRIESEAADAVTRCGSLRVAESPDEERDCDAQLAAMRRDSLPVEKYDGPEGRGIFVSSDGTFQPLDRCRALAGAALSAGVALFERSRVRTIGERRSAETLACSVVMSDQGAVRARHVVVAVDGALEVLLPELAGDVRTARLQMLATAPTSEIRIPRPVYARWGYDYWQQRPNGAIALGGARDHGGEAEWTHDTSPTEIVQSALERRLRETLGVHAAITHRWGASVGYTRDELPIVREVRRGVWAIGAYSGTGNVIGSLLGRGLARALLRNDRALLEPFLHA